MLLESNMALITESARGSGDSVTHVSLVGIDTAGDGANGCLDGRQMLVWLNYSLGCSRLKKTDQKISVRALLLFGAFQRRPWRAYRPKRLARVG